LIVAGLCKKGYFNGDPTLALKAPVNIVMQLIKYENTISEYEDIVEGLNIDGN